MVSKFALLSSLLLASAALAAPSSLVEASLARGREDHQPRPISHVMSRADVPFGICNPFAGVVLTASWSPARQCADPFGYVSATITVPVLNYRAGEVPARAVAAVVLGNYEQRRILKVGFAFGFEDDGCVYYNPIIEENNVRHAYTPNIPIYPGDDIVATIEICSATHARLFLFNPSTSPTHPPYSVLHWMREPFDQIDTAWIVEVDTSSFLPNFGNLSFGDTKVPAELLDQSYFYMRDIQNGDNILLTHVSIEERAGNYFFTIERINP